MNSSIRIIGVLLVCLLLGCDGQNRPTVWTGEAKAVSDVLADWSDVDKTDTSACQALFAKDSQPSVDKLKTLRDFNILPNGNPQINGTTATYPVLVFNLRTKGQPTPLDWTFEKEGEAWKIKNANLP